MGDGRSTCLWGKMRALFCACYFLAIQETSKWRCAKGSWELESVDQRTGVGNVEDAQSQGHGRD